MQACSPSDTPKGNQAGYSIRHFGLIVLKNSKDWQARNFGERAIERQSPPSIWMAITETPSGGRRQILADPSAVNSCRVCAADI